MMVKYGILIGYLESVGVQVQKVSKDSVILASNSMNWTLDYVGFNLEVRMKGFMPMLGNVNKKWIFPDGYSQENMIKEIESYLNWQMERLKDIAQNNSNQFNK